MRTLVFLLTHQNSTETQWRLDSWYQAVPVDNLVIVSDQSEEEFARITHPHKIHSVDPRRQTLNHQRELQSITTACQAVSQWMRGQDFTHVFFAEFDLLPLRRSSIPQLEQALIAAGADILAHDLFRVDQTNGAHYLYHIGRPGFREFWAQVTRRPDPEVVLSMLGTGSYWRREAFDAVCAFDEPFPIYMEIYLPTLAHHLGARLLPYDAARPEWRHVTGGGDQYKVVDQAQREGALFIHPLKTMSGPLNLVP